MSKNEQKILVTGATGRQGGAVVRQLLLSGFPVRALTRNPDRPAVRALAEKGVEICRGDFNDRSSLTRAVAGCQGVFSVQNFFEGGFEAEVVHGKLLADAAKAAKVKHFVYTSVAGAERHSGIPHFESKWLIEQHIRSLSLPCTIFRPVTFMESFIAFNFLQDGKLVIALPPETKLQVISARDIGVFVAQAFNDPDDFIGREIEIAGDELTMPELAKLFSQALGEPVTYRQLPLEELQASSEELALMFKWFQTKGTIADIELLRQLHPGLMAWSTWLSEVGLPMLKQQTGSKR